MFFKVYQLPFKKKKALCGVEEYVKSGRDQMVIDPDPDKICTKRKKKIMNVMRCTPPSSPSVKHPSDGWGKSLERMPSFTRIDSQVSLLKKKISDLEKKFRALEWRLFCF